MGLFRSEQPPDEDQVIPDERNIEVAVAWLILVTAWASVAPADDAEAGREERAEDEGEGGQDGAEFHGGSLLLMTIEDRGSGGACSGAAVQVEQGDGARVLRASARGRPRTVRVNGLRTAGP